MAVTMKTRKPIQRLTLADLDAFPIWEYAPDEDDGQNGTCVRPLKGPRIPRGKYSLTVAAIFTTANGRSYRGFVGVTTAEKQPEICQGVILDGRYPYLFIPNPESVTAKAKVELAAGLGLAEAEVFPMNYKLRVPVQRESACHTGSLA